MARLEDDEDAEYVYQRVPGRFYVSRTFPFEGYGEDAQHNGRASRFAYVVAGDSDGDVSFESDGGWEVVLRETGTARQQLKAIFFEHDRKIGSLVFQRFKRDGATPIRTASFALHGNELDILRTFLELIPRLELSEDAEGDRVRVTPEMARQMLADSNVVEAFVRSNPALLASVMSSEVTAPEVVAIARRKAILRKFDYMLHDDEFFDHESAEHGGPEGAWQSLMEDNPWLIGTAIAPQFLHSFDPDRLQRTIVGTSIDGAGKRPDAVLKTAGAISSLVLAEIKHHRTPLLRDKAYRPGCWSVDAEVAGGVSQCQASAHLVERKVGPTIVETDPEGFGRGFVHVCRPRTLLVVGSLEQFKDGDAVHRERYESFERFRRCIHDPEVVTFDELYERAQMSLALVESAQTAAAVT